jgi:ABC-2 type transport system ATP-binding protein
MLAVYSANGYQVKGLSIMDTTLFIIVVVAIVFAVILRIMLRSFRRRQAGRDRDEEWEKGEEVSSREKTIPMVEGIPSQIETRLKEVGKTFQVESTTPIAEITPSESKTDVKKEVQVEISHINKSFGGNMVVQDVSFTIETGEVFGLVGPNGAGKTTTIRMLMDIIRPDSGEIRLFGQPLGEESKNRIGYLPEERGLYRKMRVSDTLAYLASLKNVETRVAKERAEELLREMDMLPHRGKKISELSRGMGQIIQFLVTITHSPDLIILDEPFAGLDPVNRQLLKGFLLGLRRQGKVIILSTHMMNEVEEMCDRILMIDKGRVVLYGNLAEIKWRFRNNSVVVDCDGDIGELDGVSGRKEHGKYMELFLDGDTTPQEILGKLVARNLRVNRFEVTTPSLNEIFLQVVKQ